MRQIAGAVFISTVAALFDAQTQFAVLSEARPPSALQGGLCLQFKTPSGLTVGCVDDDRVVIIDHQWFDCRGYHLVVGPTLYHAAKVSQPSALESSLTPPMSVIQLQRAHALAQIFRTLDLS